MFLSFFGSVLCILNYNHFENYLASRLYRVKGSKAQPHMKRPNKIEPSPWCNICDYLIDLMPSCLTRCCEPDWRRRSFEIMRDKMEEEINIVKIVQSRRFFKNAIQKLLSKQDYDLLRTQSK